ncbi:glycoside hydrolase family 26 protein [Krasilnikovia sp. M28-CT-15]|uniref:glycoside hydrolase family 26 protein n=1 Tax=Krasilnikovia sp. M28-CT-15 TaxID=3373540 RepID=UPI00399D37F9
MASQPASRRRSLWIATGTVLIALLGLGAATAVQTKAETSNTGAVPPPPTRTASQPPASAPTGVPATTPPQRSAHNLLALPRAAGAWPGPNGLSGVNGDPVLDATSVAQFCAARGRPCRVAQTYTDRTSYESMTSGTGWTFEYFADFDGVLVISQGLVPIGGEAALPACARGEFDQSWRNFGNLMVQHGRGDSIVRLGWEFNERTSPWGGRDPQTWIACYRHAADALRATNPAVVFDWTINAHNTPPHLCGGLSTNCYPGDKYVDIVGIDNYDHYPWSPTKADFDRVAARPEGLTWLYEFALRHGKPFAVGEWGVVPTGDAGRDNPEFVRWMHDWFAARAPHLAYEAYFSNCDRGGVQSSLFRVDAACTRNTGSADVYRGLFGPDVHPVGS